ncbi:shikimate kinase AroL [Providencia huaxiensis]|uniref:Shikimate kinase 1 n=1 Tax=Providencia huaxiensis TaxID=2027290 RepID=A0A345LWJ5_9GAMM|nr:MULTISPECIES: shikimate kinase AroL [Providencia]MBZ3683056.1 shikimate kinase AroL [Providencia rettgeri]AXH62485.1 shikimate kinase AroL [Providencia huaxiensis]MBN6360828.1 shikimate kinase AroL [Providencia huaxiensis]MBQ0270141.1 shikimate kinase AroL [Providencia huaxiensis]MBQ0534531.1 shikimate kinase AroL [Providencia huaxiensis]
MFYIIGPRGAGKTTIGKKFAESKGYQFVDTDKLILEKAGKSIAEIVEQHGWDYFRQLETDVLKSITQSDMIVSTGGGLVLAEENQQIMRNNGTVIYLNTNPEVLAKRLAAEPQADQRPSLTGKSLVEEIEEVMQQREPIYRATAHHIIDAAQPVDDIITQLNDLT